MKRWHWIAIVALAVPLLVVVALYVLGGRTQVYQATVEINAPPEEVFPYLTEPNRITEWVDGVTEVTPQTEGGHKVGARAKVVVEENGNRYEFLDEVIESRTNEVLAVRSESDIFIANNRWELTPVASGTRVEVTMRADFRGVFRLFAPMMKSTAESQLQADFETLKSLVESPPDEPPPPAPPPVDNAPAENPPLDAPAQPNVNETTDWMMT